MSVGHERYLLGAGVFVPAHVAAWLDRAANLRALRARVRGNNSEIDAVLLAIGVASQRHQVGSDIGTSRVPTSEPQASSEVLDTRQTADRLRIGQRAVCKAIQTGALPAKKVSGRWVLTHDDVDNYGTRSPA